MRPHDPTPYSLPARKRKVRGPTIAKDVNRMRVYFETKKLGTTNRSELAKILDLNKNTVNAIVDEWIRAGYLRDLGTGESSGAGRKPVRIEFRPDNRLALGFQISSGMLHGIVANLKAEPLHRFAEPLSDTAPESIAGKIAEAVDRLEQLFDSGKFLGLGVGLPGILNEDRGLVQRSSHLDWENVSFRSILDKTLAGRSRALPVFLDNSVRLASLGELWHGRGGGYNPFVYCNFGVGVGCGLIVGGAIVRGQSNSAGELGHIVIDPQGRTCRCGRRGCLETVVGLAAVEERIGSGEINRLLNGDEAAIHRHRQELQRIGSAIGQALSGLVTLINPGLIVCDGPLMKLSDALLPAIREEIDRRVLTPSAEILRIVRSDLYPYAGSLGAAASVIEARESHLDSEFHDDALPL